MLLKDEMVGRGLFPNVITYSALISCAEKTGDARAAVDTLREMQAAGVEPNVFTYVKRTLLLLLCPAAAAGATPAPLRYYYQHHYFTHPPPLSQVLGVHRRHGEDGRLGAGA